MPMCQPADSAQDVHPPTSHSLQNAAASSAKSEEPSRRNAVHLSDTATQSPEERRERAYKMASLQQHVGSRCLQEHALCVELRHHSPQLPRAL